MLLDRSNEKEDRNVDRHREAAAQLDALKH